MEDRSREFCGISYTNILKNRSFSLQSSLRVKTIIRTKRETNSTTTLRLLPLWRAKSSCVGFVVATVLTLSVV